mmetsp:Transcript_19443/g.26700  ORF Transcript_19443/g.26700 Transcript_19443/m.26700 type:complete len:230 (-) Transcript_19443:276-965(-)|eukprot:CAMPEP_0185728866 /NCGR_PEP_ID=MMETSP1171-20130828/4268_1 /TAXON_ID=374046 /ORGANISM="Helicotheca tamensis, Strain CCMP826" /LENGTH=229 /DNA_ID=CAMNT_0028397615 /DNA_START=56 /DNA_END=745 /DNA_ORIENTATION=+
MMNGIVVTTLLNLFILSSSPSNVSAFAFAPTTSKSIRNVDSAISMKSNEKSSSSRRELFQQTTKSAFLAIATATTGGVPAAFAAGAPPTKEELERIKIGYDNIQYLLNNFEKETTICKENGGECKRDADPVRRYMGLRSTTDPLFQIEKVFTKVKYMDIDPDKLEDFFEATEDWNTAVNMSNSMAFISQFGEYNPGGGKDEVLKYLEEAKKQVILAEKSLSKIKDCLEI